MIRNRHAELRSARRGLSRVEVLTAAAFVILPVFLLGPALTGKTRGDDRLQTCLGNLRQMGTALQMYFQEANDWFPWEKRNRLGAYGSFHGFYYGGHPGRRIIPPEHWWGYIMPTFRDTPGGRPLNNYIYPGLPKVDIDPNDPRFEQVRDVAAFRCPADTGAIWTQSNVPVPSVIPLYFEVGTSYDCDYPMLEWATQSPRVQRWMNYANAYLRVQLRRNASSFVVAYEDPFDFALQNGVSRRGWHGEQDRHTMLFLDGHGAYMHTDFSRPRSYGVGWKTGAKLHISGAPPGWWEDPNDPDYRYRDIAPVP